MYTYDRRIDKTLGYAYFMDKNHPLANAQGKVYEHRHIASIKEGRWIESHEHVHHRDGDKANNSPENLEVLTATEHGRLHQREAGGGIEVLACLNCGTEFEVFRSTVDTRRHCSRKCAAKASEKIDWPEVGELLRMVEESSYLAVGRVLGVSDNAIRKRIKSRLG